MVVLGLDVPEQDYLQVRRRALRGSVSRPESLHLKKNSILIGYKRGVESSVAGVTNPFKLAYICAGNLTYHTKEQKHVKFGIISSR